MRTAGLPLNLAPFPIVPAGWPWDAAEARRHQQAAGPVTRRSLDLGAGDHLDLTLIPPGEFVTGCATGADDERPPCRVRIDRPCWLGTCEGERFWLPTESQWEYACRAGTATPFRYGNWTATFSQDGSLLSVAPGRYEPNAWGRFDMHGNVAEWTLASPPYQRVFNVGFRIVCEPAL